MIASIPEKIDEFCRGLIPGAPPIHVGHPLTGPIGHVTRDRGLQLNGMSRKAFESICAFENRWSNDIPWRGKVARALNREKFDLEEWQFHEARRLMRSERGAITTWDGILNARANGNAEDVCAVYNGITTVSGAWSTCFRAGGSTGTGAYTNIPTGSTKNATSLGSPTFANVGSSNKKYLINFGVNQPSNTAFMLLVDLLCAAGNISATSTGVQTVSSAALTRYSGVPGNYITFDITTPLGATASNITVTYTNSSGTGSRSSGAQAMLASGIAMRLTPTALGFMCPLQSGDVGVNSVQSVQLSASMTAGVFALNIFRPLLFMPHISGTSWVERSTPAMLGGVIELVKESGNDVGCLVPFMNPGGTAPGLSTYFIQTANG